MLRVSRLLIYPIKSLGGIELDKVEVTDRGFEHDRRWMLVDSNNRFISQREYPHMALLKVNITPSGLQVMHAANGKNIIIPFEPQTTQNGEFIIWDDTVKGTYVSPDADEWFSDILGIACRLVYMPEHSRRLVDPNYAPDEKITSFSDAYPFLIIGQSSLDELNDKLEVPVPMDRFRPNIVFTGAGAHAEDTMANFTIGNINFTGVKLCARCNIPTIDQQTGIASKEPTRTLAHYRRWKNNIYFGQNLIHTGEGTISVGDSIEVTEEKEMPNSLTMYQRLKTPLAN